MPKYRRKRTFRRKRTIKRKRSFRRRGGPKYDGVNLKKM